MRIFNTRAAIGTIALASSTPLLACGAADSEPSDSSHQNACQREQALTVPRPSPRLLLTDALLTRLQERARQGDTDWTALKSRCDDLTSATMHPPSGPAYPSYPDVGIGYQGDEYVEPTLSLGLCYRVSEEIDQAAAERYGEAGQRLLTAISTPESEGGFRVSTNSGYGIRHFGLAMSVGYDWLYPALSEQTRTRVVSSLNAFVDWYDESGFLRNDPIANYFMGYFQAKTYTALATEGDNPKAAEYWKDVKDRLWTEHVEPAFSTLMVGGGWPEGWGYGPRAVRGFVETLWGVKTAKGLDWVANLSYVRDSAPYLTHFAWPSLDRMDDYGTVRSGVSIGPSVGLATTLASVLDGLKDDGGPLLRSFANDVIAAHGDTRHAWERFFLSDPKDATRPYTDDALMHVAEGPGHVAARSSWDQNATWMSLNAGPYINAVDSGEQLFNAGEVSFVHGGDPILVRATGWIPHTAHTEGENFVYADSFDGGGRRLYNTFFVDDETNIYNPGQAHVGPQDSATAVTRIEDGGAWVRARGEHLGDQYGLPAYGQPVEQYTRDAVYLRSGALVLYDRTTVESADADQWMAFHVPDSPASTPSVGEHAYEIESGNTRGTLEFLLPARSTTVTEPVLGGTVRIENHASAPQAQQSWLTAVTAGDGLHVQERISAEDGNVLSGDVVGVRIAGIADNAEEQVVLFPSGHSPDATIEQAKYVVDTSKDSAHLLVDVKNSAQGYAVTTELVSGQLHVSVSPGGPLQVSDENTLSFQLDAENYEATTTADSQVVQDGDSLIAESDPVALQEDPAPAAEPGPGRHGSSSAAWEAPAVSSSGPSGSRRPANLDRSWWRSFEARSHVPLIEGNYIECE